MILMLWFYISGLVLLTGAEMNAEIEHASPHGKSAGEKAPGGKKKSGRRPSARGRNSSGRIAKPFRRP